MRLVYLAGKISDDAEYKVQANIETAALVARLLWQWGLPTICPHLNTYHMGGVVPYEVFLQGDLLMIDACDGVVLMPNAPWSRGAQIEKAYAVERGIPIFRFPEDTEKLRAWAEEGKAPPELPSPAAEAWGGKA